MTERFSDRSRRRRYTRQPTDRIIALTALKLRLLESVGRYRLLSLPQIARLAGLSPKAARVHLRALFDHGLVDVIAVPRVAVADVVPADDTSLLYGSAPNVYHLTAAGLKLLQSVDRAEGIRLMPGRYGPRNSLFLAHELAVKDAIIWFELSARRHPGHSLETWREGEDAAIDLRRSSPPRVCRPDVWLRYRIGARTLVALVEADRATERGSRRWSEKIMSYQVLFQGGLLKETTGYAKGRLLVFTPDARRRDRLAAFLAKHAPAWLADRCWLADRTVFATADLHQVGWRQPASAEMKPLLPQHGPTPLAATEAGRDREAAGSNDAP